MSGGLWVGLLGPLDVRLDGRPIHVPGRRTAIVLAVLALSVGRPVATEALARAVWSDRLPERVQGSLRSIVTRLRHVLGRTWIRTSSFGYALDADPDQVDLLRFRRLVSAAAAAAAGAAGAEGAADASRLLDQALELWRGEPLSGLLSEELERVEIPRLIEERLVALQQRIDIRIGAGDHADALSDLRELTARHPLREPLWQRLIIALAGSGHHAEAVEAYHELRVRLRDELGLDPAAELQALYLRLLAGHPVDAGPAGGRRVAPVPVPNLLPPAAADFTGRAREVAEVRRALTAEKGDAVTICALAGRPGIGKTALAVHVAHELRTRFADGQLYANLRGAEHEPRDPADVLVSFLRALGIDGPALPESLDARAELYRTRLAGRRVLVVLDDAGGEWQVRPLLPGDPMSATLITSRRTIAGLEGARRIELDLLDPQEAVRLLAGVAGPARVAREPAEARAVVGLCARLPLAVRVAGARLAARPHWPIAELAVRLRDQRRRLDELAQGDLEVRASLALSYRGVDDVERRAFRRLGMLDVPEFPAWVAAPLLGLETSAGVELVERLRDAQLLEHAGTDPTGHQRFRFHDLVRLYARERAAAEEPPEERGAALRRLFGAWCALLRRGEPRRARDCRGRIDGGWEMDAAAAGALLSDPLRWFDSELPALLGCVGQACEEGLDDLAAALATAMAPYLETRGVFDAWRRTHEAALVAARRSGIRGAEGGLLWGLGDLHTIQDRYEEALDCFRLARHALRDAGHERGESAVLAGTGFILRLRDRNEEAIGYFQRARATALPLGDRQLQVDALHGIASVRLDQGRFDEAHAAYEKALSEARAAGYRIGEVRMLRGLGTLELARGRLDLVPAKLEEALALCRALGDRPAEAYVLLQLGELRRMEGRVPEARSILERCLALYRTFGDRFNEALTLRSLGELEGEQGDLDRAGESLREAVLIYRELRLPLWEIRTASRLEALARPPEGGGGGPPPQRR